MKETVTASFHQTLETVELLSVEDQELLLEIIHQRLSLKRREDLSIEIQEARSSLQKVDIRKGSVADLMIELTSCEY